MGILDNLSALKIIINLKKLEQDNNNKKLS